MLLHKIFISILITAQLKVIT